MKTRGWKVAGRLLCVAALATALGTRDGGAQAQVPPHAANPALMKERVQALMEIDKLFDEGKLFAHPEARTSEAAAAIAVMNRFLTLDQQMVQAGTFSQSAALQWQVIMHIRKLALGDAPTRRANDAAAAKGGYDATQTAICLAGAEYLDATDEPTQIQAIDHLEHAFKMVRQDNTFVYLSMAFRDNPPASAAVARRLAAFIKAGPEPLNWKWEPEPGLGALGEMESLARRLEIVNQPLTLEGPLAGGGTISTAKWKGKVVLVDFWATWCAPCVAALPSLAKLYAADHAKGLEILGVSADEDAAKLNAFLAAHPQFGWPQLYDAAQKDQRAYCLSYGVNHFPGTWIIDRKGVAHAAQYDDDLEKTISQLLAEAP